MKEIIDKLSNWDLVKLLGGLSFIISAIITYLAKLFSDYISSRNNRNTQKEIETLKHQYSKTENMLENVSKSIANAFSASNTRVTIAFENVWKTMLELRRNMPPFIFTAYSALTKEEIKSLPKTDNPLLLKQYVEINYIDFFKNHNSYLNNVEIERPFIGQDAWNILYTYQAFIGRLVLLFLNGLKKEEIKIWLDDKNFNNQILGMVIDKDTLKKLLANEVLAFNNILSYLEMKMQNEIQNHLFGREITKETLKQAIEFSKTISLLNNEEK